ncbi:hypothetical protein JW906_00745 [bacterium]|nr:hypothetical protein [bacterium]
MNIRESLMTTALILALSGHGLSSQITLQGIVTDNGPEPVEDALVELSDQADPARVFTDLTDSEGKYAITITETGMDAGFTVPGAFRLSQNFPNPFNPSTVIAYELPRPSRISIDIHNVLGQKVKTLFEGYAPERCGQVVWDATDREGRGVLAGVYIYSLNAEGMRIHRKMLLLDGGAGSAVPCPQRPAENRNRLNKPASDVYRLRVSGEGIDTYTQPDVSITANTVMNLSVERIVTDSDGNVYRTVKIGSQWWTAENLKTTHYWNGESIPNVTDVTEWKSLQTGVWCDYENDPDNASVYGHLYNWYAAGDSRGVVSLGWHLPSDEEWKVLEMQLGMSRADADRNGERGTDEGGKLKETGMEHWLSPNEGANDATGFTALPGGYFTGNFLLLGIIAGFWSSTDDVEGCAKYRTVSRHSSAICRLDADQYYGMSVRLVRDARLKDLIGIQIGRDVYSLNPGESASMSCTALLPDQSMVDVTAQTAWTVSPSEAGSVDGNGLFTAASRFGPAIIQASYDGFSDSAAVNVLETGTLTDIDGNVYRTVKIGEQWWMAENLKVTHYRNGAEIPYVATDKALWTSLGTPAYCYYDNDSDNVAVYGLLYNFYAVSNYRNIAPAGWHVPSDSDWKTLEKHLGMSQAEADDWGARGTAGGKLKETGDSHWIDPNTGATNESGFSALPGGYCFGVDVPFHYLGNSAFFWTSTANGTYEAWSRQLEYDQSWIYRSSHQEKVAGLTVRLVKD